jgi:hypothetical protein
LHSKSLNVFERSLGGLEFMLAPLHAEICTAFMAGPENLERLSQEVAAKVAEERNKTESSQGLGAPDPELLEEATRQANSLGAADPEQDGRAIGDWIQLLGGRCESFAKGGTMLGWDKSKLRRPLTAIPGGRIRRQGTFKRHQALRDESLEFFAPGHPVVDELIRDLLTSPDGRACGLSRDLGQLQAGNAFLVVTLWLGPAPDQLEPPHELVSSGEPRWSRLHQRVVQLGSKAIRIVENELTSSIIAPRSKSDGDLAPDNIEISKGELNAAFKLATKGAKNFHFDSMALIVGSGG